MNKKQFELILINKKFAIREKLTGDKYFILNYNIPFRLNWNAIFYLDSLIVSIVMFLEEKYQSDFCDFHNYIDIISSECDQEYVEIFKNIYDDERIKFTSFAEFKCKNLFNNFLFRFTF